MKRTAIGITFLTIGTFICLSIINLAYKLLPIMSVWRGHKLWFAIFGANDISNADSLFLGIPFTIGSILFILGVVILSCELFNLLNKR
ncbi:hypothetical protein J41TS12_03210 [Paenibacillus antibioticophila]|uniref:Uncharacterized protein n=1 Tax=Paenibacillus antibioticophila TaxID=1274374 RepID=A0A919XR95_9BACL|nr:hypothetical protein [Paenibacillus antibioticophila]GIO35460.1 hypothetical protein J41TS12_03210 [Paenibacillus antibioticophila]